MPKASPIPDDDVHEWLSFEFEGETFTFDVTWLMSSWSCIYGNGCLGIQDDPAPEANLGCCSYGAHFSDKADRRRVQAKALELTPDEWQFHDRAKELGGPIHKNDDGDWATRVVDGACIFLNRNGHPDGPGCAFHNAAPKRGESYVEWKPEVCWQLPLRRTYENVKYEDEKERLVVVLGEYDRRGWGSGGHDLDWYCSSNTEAHIGSEAVYLSSRDEITALIGVAAYSELARLCQTRERLMLSVTDKTDRSAFSPHPADPADPE